MEFITLFAGGQQGTQGGGLATFLPFLIILAIIYFLMMRPQMKRQKEKQNMLAALKKGDQVVTIGGIHGSVAGFKNNKKTVVLKIEKNINLTVNRSAIAGLRESVQEEETAEIGAQN